MRRIPVYHPTKARYLVILAMTVAVTFAAGCDRWHAALGVGLGFGAGWIVGGLNAPTQTTTTCFQNGVEIDCASLPENLGG